MEDQKRTVRRVSFVLWLISMCFCLLWGFILPTSDNPIVSANLPSIALLVLRVVAFVLGIAISLLYLPIKGDPNIVFNLSMWLLVISVLVAVPITEQIFPAGVGRAIVIGLAVGGLFWVLTHLLRPYREEITYPKLKDDWRSRKIIPENQEH